MLRYAVNDDDVDYQKFRITLLNPKLSMKSNRPARKKVIPFTPKNAKCRRRFS